MKIVSLEFLHSVLQEPVFNFLLTQVCIFHHEKCLIYTYYNVKIHPVSFKSPIFPEILLLKKNAVTFLQRIESVE